MVVYGNYKQIRKVQGLSFLLNSINKTIENDSEHFENRYKTQIVYDTPYDDYVNVTIHESVKVEEHVLV